VPKVLKRIKSLTRTVENTQVGYCRKCTKTKPADDFYLATDRFLDTNGLMSICKECVSDMYVMYYNSEHSLDRAIYKTCRALNVVYDTAAVGATVTSLTNREKLEDDRKTFGIYKTKLASSMRGLKSSDPLATDFTFKYENSSIPEYSEDQHNFDGAEGVVEYWGDGFSTEDYRFLEKELASWKNSYSCQNKAEEFFMKQISIKALEIEKARKEEHSVDAFLKSMQELLKNAALTPAQQTAASSGKGTETWGAFIKNIEDTTPAEFYKDKELFKDFDGIQEYIKKYITRPLKNFITGSRDFNITEDDNTEYDEIPVEVVNNGEKEGQTE
jgi:hypothetical protein